MTKKIKIINKIMKKRMGKRGLSLMISYVLLISFVIIISAVVYKEIENYAKLKNPINCPDGVSFFVYDIDCNMENLTFKIKNNGRFDIAGYFIRATNNTNQELATVDLSSNLISGGSNLTKSILFSQTGDNTLEPNDEKTSVFRLNNKIYSIEIVPVRYQEVDNKIRFVQCGNARIRESVSCLTFDPLNMSGLVSWWRFEENANDETGRNNGVNNGAIWTTGKSGSSAYFEGSSYITVPNSSSLDITGSISIAVWVNSTRINPPSESILDKHDGNDGYSLEIDTANSCSSNSELRLQNGNGDFCGDKTNINKNNWIYVVVTYNSSNTLFYINNVLNDTKAGSSTSNINSIDLIIGSEGETPKSKYFEGQLDELMIFNRVINSTEITQLYNYFA